jgi:hypothetical protein
LLLDCSQILFELASLCKYDPSRLSRLHLNAVVIILDRGEEKIRKQLQSLTEHAREKVASTHSAIIREVNADKLKTYGNIDQFIQQTIRVAVERCRSWPQVQKQLEWWLQEAETDFRLRSAADGVRD